MKWYWIIPISLAVIGYLGLFWIIPISNASWDINIEMDNNTRDAIQSLNESIGKIQIQESYKFNASDCIWNSDTQEYWCFT